MVFDFTGDATSKKKIVIQQYTHPTPHPHSSHTHWDKETKKKVAREEWQST